MYYFDPESIDYPVRETTEVIDDVAHRAKDCLEQLLKDDCWNSQDLDDVKDCIEILCGIRKFNYYMRGQ